MKQASLRRNLDRMSDRTLALCLLWHLYQIYDSGGISCGRALRAGLLESILDMTAKPKDRYGFDPATLIRTARKRLRDPSRRGQPLVLPFVHSRIEHLPWRDFAGLALQRIMDWYKEDKKASGFMLVTEWNLVRHAYALLRGHEIVWSYKIQHVSFDLSQFVEEGKRRFREKIRRTPLIESDFPGTD